MKPWWETYPKKYWTREDWAAARKAGVVPPKRQSFELDPTSRLLAEAAQAGPKVSWGSMATTEANARRRKADLALERLGLKKPLRW